MKRSVLVLLLSLGAVLLLFSGVAQASPTYDEAVDQLIASGYPQSIEAHLNSLGTSPWGFRYGGSASDDAASYYLAWKMRCLGLANVRLEAVPVDEYDFRYASVKVGDHLMKAMTMGSSRPTPRCGVTGEIVYVGDGSAAAFDAAGDVRGKIVMVDIWWEYWWPLFPHKEAGLRGAKAVILVNAPNVLDMGYFYWAAPDGLGTFDSQSYWDAPPLVYISRNDAEWLRGELDRRVCATVKSITDVTKQCQGGMGWNVVGVIPGCKYPDQMVVVSAHHDAYWRSGVDNTSACAAMLTMAKAMKMSRYRPERTVVFFSTTAEESGTLNSYYDWLIGSWWGITHTHTDWPGRVAGQINLEFIGNKGLPMAFMVNPELAPWIEQIVADYPGWFPYGSSITPAVWCWEDQWPLTAAGIPSVNLMPIHPDFSYYVYHTQLETADKYVEWPYVAMNTKLMGKLAKDLDRGLLPYSLSSRATQFTGTVNSTALEDAGVDAALVDELAAKLADFEAACAAYDAARASIPPQTVAAVNRKLMCIERILNKRLTALSWLDATVYPHEQVLADVQFLNAAIAALELDTPNLEAAKTAIGSVGMMWYGLNFSPAVFRAELQRHRPWYYQVNWGGQGKLAIYPNLLPDYGMVEERDVAGALASLMPKRDKQLADLTRRIAAYNEMLATVTPKIEAITPGP